MKNATMPHEADQNAAVMREWYRSMNATAAGQFQLGRLHTLSWQIAQGIVPKGIGQQDMKDIGNLANQYLQNLMFNAAEVDAMEADGKA